MSETRTGDPVVAARPVPRVRYRLDVVSLVLVLIGLGCGALSYVLITEHGMNPLLLVPSVVAATVGVSNIRTRCAY